MAPITNSISIVLQLDSGDDQVAQEGHEGTALIASESSEEIYKRVYSAIEIQKERFKKEDFCYNALIPAKYISKYCHLGKTESDFIRTAFEKFSFSLRSYHKGLYQMNLHLHFYKCFLRQDTF